jgi:hypothetical protein
VARARAQAAREREVQRVDRPVGRRRHTTRGDVGADHFGLVAKQRSISRKLESALATISDDGVRVMIAGRPCSKLDVHGPTRDSADVSSRREARARARVLPDRRRIRIVDLARAALIGIAPRGAHGKLCGSVDGSESALREVAP